MTNKLALMMASALLCGAAPVQAAGPTAKSPPGYWDQGSVAWGVQNDDGVVWLRLWDTYVRYRVAPEASEEMESLKALLERAVDGGRAVQVRFDGVHGQLNREAGTLDYDVCAVVLDDWRFESSHGCGDAAMPPASDPPSRLALARAVRMTGDSKTAQELLASTEFPDDVVARKLLLQLRAENEAELAAVGERLSPEADATIAASLSDYRALAALEPDNVEHQFAIAAALLDLGGYAETRAVLDAILAKWPDEDFRVAVRIGALYRVQGDYAKALQALNDLSARNGPQDGMKYHYHRGWTLSLLGRFDEAVTEFTQGLKSQPDYASAYVRRACAYAAIGRLEDALGDTREASSLLAAVPGAETALRVSIDELESTSRQLEAALSRGDGEARPGLCLRPTWRIHEQPRARSPLLSRLS